MSQWGKITLWDAAAQGDLEKCKERLKSSWTVINAQDVNGKTALMEAARWGHLEIVQFLVENGADVNIRNKDDESALFISAKFGRDDVVRFLFEKGADIEARDMKGNSPLLVAAGSGRVTTVKLLLSLGADKTVKNKEARDVFRVATSTAVRDVLHAKDVASLTKYDRDTA